MADNAENTSSDRQAAVLLRRATLLSVSVAFFLIAVKIVAYVMTDSVALLSSLVDSVLDSLASILNFVAVRHALTPADREHRFGHGKAEPLAGLGQAAFIAGSALFLIFEAVHRLVEPKVVERGQVGIAVMVGSLLLTLMLVAYQRYVVKRTGSVAIRADSLHYASDIVLNLSVMIAIFMSAQLGWRMADPLFALGISAFILYSVRQIAVQSLDQLMDRELPDEARTRIREICMRHPEVRNLHELRTRASGMDMFIQLHLEMSPDLSLLQAHRVADEVEAELRQEFPNADVIIHEDPAGIDAPGSDQDRAA